jgi:PPP family 3-phenylpropionic acid transporter
MDSQKTSNSRQLWLLRLFYFVNGGGGGFLIPFLSLFYRAKGLSGTEIGLIGTVGAICSMMSAPIAARWIGVGEKLRRALQWMMLGSLVTVLLLSQQNTFLGLAIVLGLFEFAVAGIEPASDTMTIQILTRISKSGFGSIRVWASLGWAMMALAGGWIIQRMGFLSGFLAYAFTFGITIFILMWIHPYDHTATDNPAAVKPADRKALFKTIKNPAILGFILALMISWMTRGGLYTFEPLYLKHLGATETIIGFASTLGASVELAGMLLADRLVRRYGSGNVFSMSFIIYGVGMFLVLVFPSVLTILVFHAIGGIAFSLLTVGMVMYINDNTLPRDTATVMALVTVTLHSLMGIIASPLSGLAFDAFGAYWLYMIALAGQILAFVIFHLIAKG